MKDDNKRLLTGVLLPIVLGSIGITTWSFAGFNGDVSSEFIGLFKQIILEAFIPVLIYAGVLVGVQSIIYSFLMEKIINPKVRSNILVVFYSIILGLISTVLSGFVTQKLVVFSITGAVVGFIVGIILRKMYTLERLQPDG